jgi:peptide alpha-N-acetyltransferase
MEKERERERKEEFDASEIEYVSYGGEHHLPLIMNLVDQELSEPYSIFTYRYFVYLWPQLSFLVSVILFLLFFFLCSWEFFLL